jgi:hypothetical protein
MRRLQLLLSAAPHPPTPQGSCCTRHGNSTSGAGSMEQWVSRSCHCAGIVHRSRSCHCIPMYQNSDLVQTRSQTRSQTFGSAMWQCCYCLDSCATCTALHPPGQAAAPRTLHPAHEYVLLAAGLVVPTPRLRRASPLCPVGYAAVLPAQLVVRLVDVLAVLCVHAPVGVPVCNQAPSRAVTMWWHSEQLAAWSARDWRHAPLCGEAVPADHAAAALATVPLSAMLRQGHTKAAPLCSVLLCAAPFTPGPSGRGHAVVRPGELVGSPGRNCFQAGPVRQVHVWLQPRLVDEVLLHLHLLRLAGPAGHLGTMPPAELLGLVKRGGRCVQVVGVVESGGGVGPNPRVW